MGGSETTSETAWPFIGSLNAECGPVLIGKHFALTAAHCCVDGDLKVSTSRIFYLKKKWMRVYVFPILAISTPIQSRSSLC